jgi:hypothetical protein
MKHYATLRDHHFDADLDDIRGATLYGEGGEKLAKIEDVVFDHGTGEIEYLVANEGHDRRILVPVTDVRTAITSDRDFDSDLTHDDIDHLPAFREDMLAHDDTWNNYLRLHRDAMKRDEKEARREYKQEFADDPVEHQKGDVAHLITPVEVPPAPGAKVTSIDSARREDDYIPDVTPQRLAPVFTNAAQTSDKLNMVPHAAHSRGPASEYITAGLGPKWEGYQERLRRDLPRLRGVCETCRRDEEKVA